MITEHDLQEAIAECQGQRKPNASTCLKLAAFLIIQKELYGKSQEVGYSFDAFGSDERSIDFDTTSEFSKAVNGKDQYQVLSVIDEMMEVLQSVNPNLYKSTIYKLMEVG